MVAQNIAFGLIALAMAVGAVRVVTTKNVVHAALWLILVLSGVAANFILLAAEFIAVVQVLVYIGAIIVLFLFGIMLTRAPIGAEAELDNDQRWAGAVVGLLLFGVLASVLSKQYGARHVDAHQVQRTADVANSVFTTYVVPFEVVSVLLLAALVGAVVIARRD
ncbi:MAG: NADH-quinone oxidoreductase subunit J [Acidimicrobiales bacterium]|nr:NADH-quinone oxidoreductase subunit J [Acidimicrobiales bacterium]